ncbi:MAG TPA: hypothetical protein VN193_16495 [Candidatus Angelobacter sp.]|nr:hypothetical protein [Candidatus Angelobacter sp.]
MAVQIPCLWQQLAKVTRGTVHALRGAAGEAGNDRLGRDGDLRFEPISGEHAAAGKAIRVCIARIEMTRAEAEIVDDGPEVDLLTTVDHLELVLHADVSTGAARTRTSRDLCSQALGEVRPHRVI